MHAHALHLMTWQPVQAHQHSLPYMCGLQAAEQERAAAYAVTTKQGAGHIGVQLQPPNTNYYNAPSP